MSPLRQCLAAVAMAAALVGCGSKPSAVVQPPPPGPSPMLVERLSPEWLGKASRIHTGDFHIFYQGTADGNYSADGARWSGTITGDILMLTKVSATIAPEGSIKLNPDGRLVCNSRSSTFMGDFSAHWKPLLRS